MERVSFVEDVPSKRYRFCEQLGKGADCNVCRAVDRENPGLTYAVRIFRVDISKESEIKALLKIRNEIAVMDICALRTLSSTISRTFTSSRFLCLLNTWTLAVWPCLSKKYRAEKTP